MNAHEWDNDDRLAADLGAALREDQQLPARFVEVAEAAYAWRTVDAELAALTYDSAMLADAAAGMRAAAQSRSLILRSTDVTFELELTADALLGQVVPARGGTVQITTVDGESTIVAADDVGWFALRPRPSRTFRLTARIPGVPSVTSEWITV